MSETVIEIHAEDTLAMLMRVSAALSGPSMALFLTEVITPYIRLRGEARFAAEGDDVSGKWAPLQPATVAIREANPDWPVGGEHPINVRTSELEEYVTQSDSLVMPSTTGAVMRYPEGKATGELQDKMETAQVGRDRTVARPVLGVNQTDLLFTMSRLAWWIERAASA